MPPIRLPPPRALPWTLPDFSRERALSAARAAAPPRETSVAVSPVNRAGYSAAYNVTTNTPSRAEQGVQLARGRAFLELRSAENAGAGGGYQVVLEASANGVRGFIESSDATGALSAITGGLGVWWMYDEVSRLWFETGIQEQLALASRAATTDQLLTVGAR